jgi:magnesium-protoporphyrin O-methyltransferase
LDRVICCYPDMQKLVSLSADKARRLYGVVYPRDTWWARGCVAVYDWWQSIAPSAFRLFLHPSRDVDRLILSLGFHQYYMRETLLWRVVVYARG